MLTLFGDFKYYMFLCTFRQYEVRDLQVQEERAAKRMEFDNQKQRLMNQIEFEKSRDTSANVGKWEKSMDVDEKELEKLKKEEGKHMKVRVRLNRRVKGEEQTGGSKGKSNHMKLRVEANRRAK